MGERSQIEAYLGDKWGVSIPGAPTGGDSGTRGLIHEFWVSGTKQRQLPPDPAAVTATSERMGEFSCTQEISGGPSAAAGMISAAEFAANPTVYAQGTTWLVYDRASATYIFGGELRDPESSGGGVRLTADGWAKRADHEVERLLFSSENIEQWVLGDSDPFLLNPDDNTSDAWHDQTVATRRISSEVNGDRLVFNVVRHTHFWQDDNGDPTSFVSIPWVFWAPNCDINRIAFNIHKSADDPHYDLELIGANGNPDLNTTSITTINTWSMSGAGPSSVDQAIGSTYDLIGLRVRRVPVTGLNKKKSPPARRFQLTNIKVGGIVTAEPYTLSDGLVYLANKLGVAVGDRDIQTTNTSMVPYDVARASWGQVLDDICLLDSYFWRMDVTDDGARAFYAGPIGRRSWKVTETHQPVTLLPGERYNKVSYEYHYGGGYTATAKVTADPNPFPAGYDATYSLQMEEPPIKAVASALAQKVADYLAKVRHTGSATLSEVSDNTGVVYPVGVVRPGDELVLTNYGNKKVYVESIGWAEDGAIGEVRFTNGNPLLDRWLARRTRLMNKGIDANKATLMVVDPERPATPVVSAIAFYQEEARAGQRFYNMVVDWTAVNEDIDGQGTAVDEYIVRIRPLDGPTGDPIAENAGGGWRKKTIREPESDDPDLSIDTPTKAIFHKLPHPHSWYWQGQVQAIDMLGQRSQWSTLTSPAVRPSAFYPENPTNLSVNAVPHRVNAEWVAPPDPDDSDAIKNWKPEVDSFMVQFSADTNAGTRWNEPTNEVQRITLTDFSGTDSFKLTFNGHETAIITRGTNATPEGIKVALQGLSDFESGDIRVSGTDDAGPFDVTFQGAYASTNVSSLSVTSPVGCSGSVSTITGGAAGGLIKTVRVKGESKTFFVHKSDGRTFYVRVRSVDTYGNKNPNWVTADNSEQEPTAPTSLAIDFEQHEKHRHANIDMKLSWAESSWVHGDIDEYVVQVESSESDDDDFNDASKVHVRRFVVDAKKQTDESGYSYKMVGKVVRHRIYRFKVRAVGKGRVKGSWSTYFPSSGGADPLDEISPPTPLNVKIFTTATDRVVLDWDAPETTTRARGTASATASGNTVTGVGTKFFSEIGSGTVITLGAESKTVRKVTSDTALTIIGTWSNNHTDERLFYEDRNPDVQYYQAEISKGTSPYTDPPHDYYVPPYKRDVYVHATKKAFKIGADDEGDAFFGRVRSVDASGNKSRWVDATHATSAGGGGNSKYETEAGAPTPESSTLAAGGAGAGAGVNAWPNSSFETDHDANGVPNEHTKVQSGVTNTVSLANTHVRQGEKSVRVQWSGGTTGNWGGIRTTDYVGQRLGAPQGGEIVFLSGWVGGTLTNAKAQIHVEWFNDADVSQGTTTLDIPSVTAAIQRFTGFFTVPATSKKCYAYVRGYATAASASVDLYFDAVQLAEYVVFDDTDTTSGWEPSPWDTWETDGARPTSTPTPTVRAGALALEVFWAPIDNGNDEVTYEVHLSDVDDFTVASGTKSQEVTGTATVITQTVAGGVLLAGTTYYVKIVAKDRDGAFGGGTYDAPTYGGTYPQGSATLGQIGSDQVGSDGEPPSFSPVPDVEPGPAALGVKWKPVANKDLVKYEVHLSDTGDSSGSSGPSTQFLEGAWHEKPLPSTAPIHPNNADYLRELDGAYYGTETDGFPACDPAGDNFGLTGATTTLNGGITAGATSMTVNSGTGFPAAPFRVKIDSENIVVTSKGSGTNWTIVRFNGTDTTGLTFTAASHSNGATVTWFKKAIAFNGSADDHSLTTYDTPIYRPSATDTLVTIRPKAMAQLFHPAWGGSTYYLAPRFRPPNTDQYENQGYQDGLGEGIRLPADIEDYFDPKGTNNDNPCMVYISPDADPQGSGGYWASFGELRYYSQGVSYGGHVVTADEAGWYAQGANITKLDSYGITSGTQHTDTKATPSAWGEGSPKHLWTGVDGTEVGVEAGYYQTDTENYGGRGNNCAARAIDYDRLVADEIIPYITEFFCERTAHGSPAPYRFPFDGGENNKGGLIPEGTRLRIKGSYTTAQVDAQVEAALPVGQNINGAVVTQTRQDQMKYILRGLHQYGLVVGDNSGSGGRLRTEAQQREPGASYLWEIRQADLSFWPYADYWEFIDDNYDPPTPDYGGGSEFTPSATTRLVTTPGSSHYVSHDHDGNILTVGQTYYVKIVAKDADGSAAPSAQTSGVPYALKSDQQTSDGVRPAAAPTPTLRAAIGYLSASWTPIASAPNDPVTYEVHVGTTAGFTISASTRVGVTTGTSFPIRVADSGGTALSYGQNYYCKIVPKDVDGAYGGGTYETPTYSWNPPTPPSASGAAQLVQVVDTDIANDAITTTKIADDAITTPLLAANSVTTAKLTVASFDNVLANGGFEKGNTEWTLTTATIGTGAMARSGSYRLAVTAISEQLSHAVDANETAQFYAETWHRCSVGGSGTVRIGIRWLDSAGATLSTTWSAATATSTPGYTAPLGINGTAPTNTASMKIVLDVTAVTGTVYFDDVYARRMMTGELIVDGTITTGELAADSITAEKLAVNSVTARNLVIGDAQNLIFDPSFESDDDTPTAASCWQGWNTGALINTVQPHTGTHAARLIATNAYFETRVPIPTTAGNRYALEFWTFGNAAANGTLRCDVIWYSNAGATIRTDQMQVAYPGEQTGVYSLQEMPELRAPAVSAGDSADAASLRVKFICTTYTAGNMYIDDVYLRPKTAAGKLIVDGTIMTEHLAAGQITADRLAADLVLSSTILAGDAVDGVIPADQPRVVLSSSGVELKESESASPSVYLPTDPDQPALFEGTVEATNLTVTGAAKFESAWKPHVLSNGAELELASTVSDPVNPPTLSLSRERLTVASWAYAGTRLREGFFYYSAGDSNKGSWYVQAFYGTQDVYISQLKASDRSVIDWGYIGTIGEHGFYSRPVRVGSTIWIAKANTNQGTLYLWKFDTSYNNLGSVDLTASIPAGYMSPSLEHIGLAYDGANLLISLLKPPPSAGVKVLKCNSTTGAYASTTTVGLTPGAGVAGTRIEVAESKWWFTEQDSSGNTFARRTGTDGTRVAADQDADFPLAGAHFGYDSFVASAAADARGEPAFVSGARGSMFMERHTGWTWANATSSTLWVKYSYSDGLTRTISSATRSGTTATFTSTGHGYNANDEVTITGMLPVGYNGHWKIATSATDTFTATLRYDPGGSSTQGGTARRRIDVSHTNPTPYAGITLAKRSRLLVSFSNPSTGTGLPDHSRVWAYRGSSPSGTFEQQAIREADDAATILMYTDYSGTQDAPTSNDFSGGTPAKLTAAGGLSIEGDGRIVLPSFSGAAAGPATPVAGQTFWDSAVGTLMVFDGTYWRPLHGALSAKVVKNANQYDIAAGIADYDKISFGASGDTSIEWDSGYNIGNGTNTHLFVDASDWFSIPADLYGRIVIKAMVRWATQTAAFDVRSRLMRDVNGATTQLAFHEGRSTANAPGGFSFYLEAEVLQTSTQANPARFYLECSHNYSSATGVQATDTWMSIDVYGPLIG